RFDGDALELNLQTGKIVRVGQAPQPAEGVGVQPYDGGVRHRSLAEVQLPIGTDSDHVRVVVAWARKVIEHRRAFAARHQAADPPRVPSLGYVEGAFMKDQPVDGRAEPVGEKRTATVGRHAPDSTADRWPVKSQAGFGNIDHPAVAERNAR